MRGADPNPGLEALEHGCVLEHVRYDHEPDPAAPDEDVLQLRHLAVLGSINQIKSNQGSDQAFAMGEGERAAARGS